MIELKICPVCGKEFVPARAWSVYCSKECADVKARERVRESNEKRKNCKVVREKPVMSTHQERVNISSLGREEGLSYGEYVAKYLWKR